MRRHGFTLVELVVVLTIAGVLLALLAPRFLALRDGAAVRAAIGDLGTAFSAARQEAIVRRAPVVVVLDTAGGSMELRSAGRPILRRPLATMYGVVIRSNRDSVVYDPRGLGYGLANLSVTVRRGSIVDTLTMSRLGRVRW
jgi:prepilin-type N-terminal cleavage/methylation domain-containing protein